MGTIADFILEVMVVFAILLGTVSLIALLVGMPFLIMYFLGESIISIILVFLWLIFVLALLLVVSSRW